MAWIGEMIWLLGKMMLSGMHDVYSDLNATSERVFFIMIIEKLLFNARNLNIKVAFNRYITSIIKQQKSNLTN